MNRIIVNRRIKQTAIFVVWFCLALVGFILLETIGMATKQTVKHYAATSPAPVQSRGPNTYLYIFSVREPEAEGGGLYEVGPMALSDCIRHQKEFPIKSLCSPVIDH